MYKKHHLQKKIRDLKIKTQKLKTLKAKPNCV